VTILSFYIRIQDSSVGTATGYGLDGPGSIPGMTIFFCSLQRSHWHWGPPSLIFNGYWGLFPRGQSGWCVKLITHFHLVPMLRMVKLYLHYSTRLHGIELHLLSTVITLPLPPIYSLLYKGYATALLAQSLQQVWGTHFLFSCRNKGRVAAWSNAQPLSYVSCHIEPASVKIGSLFCFLLWLVYNEKLQNWA
jgi:hypothetical protein